MNKTPLAVVVLVSIVVAACGGDGSGDRTPASSASPTTATTAASPAGSEPGGASRFTREQVIEALGVTRGRDENGVMNSDLKTGCFAIKIFVTPEDNMAAYIQIGDPVATNPSGEVGAAIGTYAGVSASKCLKLFERRLLDLG